MQISLMDELRESQNLLDSYWIWWEFMVKGTKIEKKKIKGKSQKSVLGVLDWLGLARFGGNQKK